jgi:hypothetical protein
MGCAQLTHGRFTRALVGEQAPAPVLAWLSDRTTETRNYGETDREHLPARKWKSYSAETSAGACRPPDLCHSYNRRRRHEPADFTAQRLAAARGTEAPWIAVARPRAYLRTAGALDRCEDGRPGCCYRPKAVTPREGSTCSLLVQSSSRRQMACSALGGFRSAWVSSHAGDARRRCWSGRAGELDRAVGRLLLVTVAEVRLNDAALRRHRLREVFDSYMRMPSETTASVSSPTDDR